MIMAYLISNPQFNVWNITYITLVLFTSMYHSSHNMLEHIPDNNLFYKYT